MQRARRSDGQHVPAPRGSRPELAPVVTGSHGDSQPRGGRFDGIYGVLAGLEVIRSLNDRQIVTERAIEVINWTNEEGARFAPAMIASGVFAGVFDLEYGLSRRDEHGVSLGEALERIGYAGEHPVGGMPIHAAFELHIEQGPILEAEHLDIGVVTAAQGQRWYELEVVGFSAHAGTTPMDRRRDALLGFTELVTAVNGIGWDFAPDARATVGMAQITPIHATWCRAGSFQRRIPSSRGGNHGADGAAPAGGGKPNQRRRPDRSRRAHLSVSSDRFRSGLHRQRTPRRTSLGLSPSRHDFRRRPRCLLS